MTQTDGILRRSQQLGWTTGERKGRIPPKPRSRSWVRKNWWWISFVYKKKEKKNLHTNDELNILQPPSWSANFVWKFYPAHNIYKVLLAISKLGLLKQNNDFFPLKVFLATINFRDIIKHVIISKDT